MGRELTANERNLLEWLLRDTGITDAETLRAQIPFASVVEGVPAMPTYLHLAVTGASPAGIKDGPVLGNATVVVSASGDPTGGLLLWVKNGYLESVEHYWFDGDMPLEFPAVEQLRIEPRPLP